MRARLADAMASDFERDLLRDGLTADKVQIQVKRSKERIVSAPVAILLCLDMTEMDSYPDEKRQHAEWIMATQSVAAAGMQLLLAAHAEGLGAVWACWPLFTPGTIQRTLNLPPAWEPQAMFFVGYADRPAKDKELKGLQDLVKWI